ncbi:MAG TPA: alanine--tRNA ligase, partial [Anaerolineaceae bacterium]|nr:alanine--tRNA ligase [Anaerolineaceae bacterium]
PAHILYFGRKENFWEMAETGPCGPCSEIHYDKGPEYCNMKDVTGHVCQVNGDCARFLEIWNNVFIQYNRLSPTKLEPLPQRHVDTGMGLDRIVSIIQGVDSNYRTDLLLPLLQTVQKEAGHTDEEREANLTPYRVIADHSRAATFLIADGVVPGNTGRSYVCRMIIRRAARFGSKIGLNEPFMAKVAAKVIDLYGGAYPELARNRATILENLTREEERFQRTLATGMSYLQELLDVVRTRGEKVLSGQEAFDLYATHGLPLELTRDVAREQGLEVNDKEFLRAMEEHRVASGAGKAFGALGGDGVDLYRSVLEDLQKAGRVSPKGVEYDPYGPLEVEGRVLALIREGQAVDAVTEGDVVEVILPRTGFYIESGGQVSDTGTIVSVSEPRWEIRIDEVRKPAAGVIVHLGQVTCGAPRVGDEAIAAVNAERRHDIMRNHTATHLLHKELQRVLGDHARQAGSLVAPDRLRFDFNHPVAMTPEQIEDVEAGVNRRILDSYPLTITYKPLQKAIAEGAMALFGEKYGETVRTVTIGDDVEGVYSYELCGGTHVSETGDIGLFLITSEGSAAAGIRRIEAVTGRKAYELVQRRFRTLKQAAAILELPMDQVPDRIEALQEELSRKSHQIERMRLEQAAVELEQRMNSPVMVGDVPVVTAVIPNADSDTLRQMTDRFRNKYSSGVVVVGSVWNDRPMMIAAVTDDLIKRGLSAGDLVKRAAQVVGGSGGGRPNLAQAGGKDAEKLPEALATVEGWVREKLG